LLDPEFSYRDYVHQLTVFIVQIRSIVAQDVNDAIAIPWICVGPSNDTARSADHNLTLSRRMIKTMSTPAAYAA
jgi:hypothetical protein